jgi:hypothetical protein
VTTLCIVYLAFNKQTVKCTFFVSGKKTAVTQCVFKLTSALATAESWDYKGHMLKVNESVLV